jgi:hypothetical protein
VDDSSWTAVAISIISHPEKLALGVVILVGAWRWIRELIREARGIAHEESLLDMLLRERKESQSENRALREELRELRKEHHDE